MGQPSSFVHALTFSLLLGFAANGAVRLASPKDEFKPVVKSVPVINLPPMPPVRLLPAVTIVPVPNAPPSFALAYRNYTYCVEVQSTTNFANWNFFTNAALITLIHIQADKPKEFFRARLVDMRDGGTGPWAVKW